MSFGEDERMWSLFAKNRSVKMSNIIIWKRNKKMDLNQTRTRAQLNTMWTNSFDNNSKWAEDFTKNMADRHHESVCLLSLRSAYYIQLTGWYMWDVQIVDVPRNVFRRPSVTRLINTIVDSVVVARSSLSCLDRQTDRPTDRHIIDIVNRPDVAKIADFDADIRKT